MGDRRTSDGAERYAIRVMGHLEPRWAAWFDGMTLTKEDGGITCLSGTVVDQSALHGLLQRLRDVGLPLVSVQAEPVVRDAAISPPVSTTSSTKGDQT